VSAAAVRSMLLATEGVDGGHDAIDVVMRLLGITDQQLDDLQRPGELTPVALAPKWFPTCGASHTALEATLDVRRRAGDRATAADATIQVTSPPRVMNALAFARPENPDEARFSMEYCIASAWAHGSLGPSDFSTEALARASVADVIDRVEVVIDDALTPPPTWSGFPAVVTVTWADGHTDSARVERPLGYPERPLTDAQRRQKFDACVEPVLGADTARAAFDAITGPRALALAVEHLTR
jgi:2-methylcitrate dehydratase PrpD